jgi:CubicO group peptidase (beta-lactamase class C family)
MLEETLEDYSFMKPSDTQIVPLNVRSRTVSATRPNSRKLASCEGIYSSLDDLAKWDRALRDHTLLSAAEMRPALTPVQPTDGPAKIPDGPAVSYGFGWFLDPYQGHPRMSHDGSTIGFRTTIQRFPDDHLTIIVLANRTDIDPKELALKVADLYLGTKP